jgi:hypothetical protein
MCSEGCCSYLEKIFSHFLTTLQLGLALLRNENLGFFAFLRRYMHTVIFARNMSSFRALQRLIFVQIEVHESKQEPEDLCGILRVETDWSTVNPTGGICHGKHVASNDELALARMLIMARAPEPRSIAKKVLTQSCQEPGIRRLR